jgi:phage-related minor tail protein
MFKFARGGAMATGVMGEAGPEAIMPLKRGADGKLGVASAGGSGVTVNVSVDAKGTQVQGDPGQGAQLGRVVAGAVQQELIKQQRPGGLLAGGR